MSNNKKTVTSKFEKVFLVSESETILNEYYSLIAKLNNLGLSDSDSIYIKDGKMIDMIFDKIDAKINHCKVTSYKGYYEIALNFKSEETTRVKTILLSKRPYRFNYKNYEYYCFETNYLSDYLIKMKKMHEYFIEITSGFHKKKKIKEVSQFMMLDCFDFNILISYEYQDIDYKKLNYDSIYNLPNEIKGKDLNLKLGLYVDLTEDDFNEFIYYNTDERKVFERQFNYLMGKRKEFGFCGPYGTGKTITLLKTIISDINKKYLYINLGTVNQLDNEELKKLLRYEIIKLFSKETLFQEKNTNNTVEKEAFDNIVNFINNLKDKDIFSLLENIILEMNKIEYENIYFIIDQYSSKYDIDESKIKQLIDKNNSKNHIIICSSMNNQNIKDNLCQCLSEKLIFTCYRINFIYYFYVGSLIRMNNIPDYKDILKNESQDFKTYLNYFGNIPLYYYLLKNEQKQRGELLYFINKEKLKIVKEIEKFYKTDINNEEPDESLKMFLDILKIITTVNKREIFFFNDLSNDLLKLPLKFLEIKKETMKINDLKLFGLVTQSEKIKDFIETKSEEDIIAFQDMQTNYIHFFNKENYCSNYISKITEKEKKKLNFIESKLSNNLEVTIFYLEYLFPLMGDIFSSIIYKILSKATQYIYHQLSPQTKGGLLEFIISEHVKNTRKFLLYNITYVETIENFVPSEFFIQNYSTRKTDTLRIFIENKNPPTEVKKLLPKGNIFITQLQFTGKYYDCALLVPNNDYTGYYLLLLQISKRKLSSQRFFREEHMIILNRVKEKLEKEYNIKILEGHFSYILTSEELDNETINFCDNNNLNYYLFSIEKLAFQNLEIPIFTKKTFITKTFPIQSSFSILPKENFSIYNLKLQNEKYINEFQNNLIFEDIDGELKKELNYYFVSNNNKKENVFYLFGHFDNLINVNNSFCIWFNNNEFKFRYDNKGKIDILHTNYFKRLSNKNYSLICSKYSIKCNYINAFELMKHF